VHITNELAGGAVAVVVVVVTEVVGAGFLHTIDKCTHAMLFFTVWPVTSTQYFLFLWRRYEPVAGTTRMCGGNA
jgi:hypothetical protein